MNSNQSDLCMRTSQCLCCGRGVSGQAAGVASGFLAERAMGRSPFPIALLRCGACGFSWSSVGLSQGQASRLYGGYRQEEYFNQRNKHEPWYTKKLNDSMGSDEEMKKRRRVLGESLAKAQELGGPRPAGPALDYGGDKGQMLKDLPDGEKWVFEYSGVELLPWAKQARDLSELSGSCALAMACQVLEHVNDPKEVIGEIAKTVSHGGWVYLEVPDESWSQKSAGAPWRKSWVAWLCKRIFLLRVLDFASTALRVKLKWMPSVGVWALREHLNFFTCESLSMAASSQGLDVIWCAKTESGISLVGRKK